MRGFCSIPPDRIGTGEVRKMSAVFWVLIGIVVLAALAGSGKGGKNAGTKGKPVRIDHPHYFEDDDHECSVCGARFRGKGMTCPKCGARFQAAKEDDGEFIEEMVLWDDDDD